MMRGPGSVVICVRTPSGAILTRREAEILPQGRRCWPRFPVLRGMSAIYESFLCGMRALLFSAGASGEDEEPLTGKEAAGRNFSEELLRLALLPVIAGLAYEWIRFAADSGSPLVRALNRPGLWLGLLTTRAPMAIRWKWPSQYFGARRAWQTQQPPGRNDKEDTVCRRNVWTGWNPALKIWKYS